MSTESNITPEQVTGMVAKIEDPRYLARLVLRLAERVDQLEARQQLLENGLSITAKEIEDLNTLATWTEGLQD